MIRLTTVALVTLFAVTSWAQPLKHPDETYAAIVSERYADAEAYYAKVLKERPRDEKGEFILDRMIWATPVFSSDDPNSEDYWPKTDAITAKWLKDSPQSVFASITRARALVRRAESLQARNGSWKEMEKLVAEARRVMEASRAKGALDPAWHAMRLRLAGMQGLAHQQLLDLVRTAVAVDPQPLLVWQEAAIALGSEDRTPGNLTWLMRYAADSTRETEGKTMYLRVMLSAYWLYPDFIASPFKSGLDWKLMNESFEEVRQRYPKSYDANLHGAIACLAGDRRATAAAIRGAGSDPILQTWEKWGGKPHWDRCRKWAYGLRPAGA